MMPILAFDEVVAGYAAPVVGPVSLAVAAGEKLVVTGPNGVGKSTLFNALSGAARIFSGRLNLAAGTAIAYQRQHFPSGKDLPLSAEDVVSALGASWEAVPAAYRGLARRRFGDLSGGTRQFLHLFACLASGAGLVLLDEPSNNLDARAEDVFVEVLAATPAAVVLISHDAELIQRLGYRRQRVEGRP